MKKRNLFLAALAFSAAFSCAVPTFAKDFTTSDSVLTIDTPNDGWTQIKDDTTLATLTNGSDSITLQHFSNGEKLPDITVADEMYEKVCQNIISTRNEVFLITGLASDEKNFDEIQKAVQSTVINLYDTKKAIKPSDSAKSTTGSTSAASDNSTAPASDNTSTPETNAAPFSGASLDESVSFTGWITGSNVNMRSDASTDAAIVSTIPYGTPVTVTGAVSTNGQIFWYRIDLDGTTGFIAAQYLSKDAPSAEQNGITLMDEQLTLYSTDYTEATYINKATDGNWYDGTGRQYVLTSGDSWTRPCDNSAWTDLPQATPDDTASKTVTVTDSDGLNEMTLYQDSNSGIWHNRAWGVYTDNEDNTFTGPDGTIWTVES